MPYPLDHRGVETRLGIEPKSTVLQTVCHPSEPGHGGHFGQLTQTVESNRKRYPQAILEGVLRPKT